MRKSLLPVLLLALAPGLALAQEKAEVVELPINWQAGETHKLELTKSRERYKDGKRELAVTGVVPVQVEVLEKSQAGYVIRWTYGKAEFESDGAPVDPLIARLSNLTDNIRLEFKTDPRGSVTELINKEETAALYQRAITQVFDWMRENGLPEAAIAQVGQSMTALASPDAVGPLALEEPSLFHLAVGGSYTVGARREYEDLLPNPLGGEPFPSKAFFLLTEVLPEENIAVVEWEQAFDPEKSTEILLRTLTAMAKNMNALPPKASELPVVSVDDLAESRVDLNTGWPLSVISVRHTTMASRRRVERKEFRLISVN